MGRPRKNPSGLLQCVEGFVTPEGLGVSAGEIVRADDPIVKRREWAFKPVEPPPYKIQPSKKAEPTEEKAAERPKVEQATAAPGEKRGEK